MTKSTVKRSAQHLDAAEGDASCRALPNNDFAKRQKTLTYSASESSEKNNYNHEKSNLKLGGHLPVAEFATLSDSSDSHRSICAFCNSSKITEVSFKM